MFIVFHMYLCLVIHITYERKSINIIIIFVVVSVWQGLDTKTRIEESRKFTTDQRSGGDNLWLHELKVQTSDGPKRKGAKTTSNHRS